MDRNLPTIRVPIAFKPGAPNHFAQNSNFNRGGYRVLEDQWAKDIKVGKQVYVAITSSYAGSSQRPSAINVTYFVDGQRGSQPFANSSKGKPHGK